MVAADDVHWLDDATRDARSRSSLAVCSAEGVVLLSATRAGARGARGLLRRDRRWHVSGLDDAAAAELLRREAPHRVADDVATGLVATAHGNPLALTEIPRVLSPDQLAGREPLTGPVPTGSRLEDAFAPQIAGLPASTREALLMRAAMQTAATTSS